jgi:DNA-binding transcriptional ArsR family regulator
VDKLIDLAMGDLGSIQPGIPLSGSESSVSDSTESEGTESGSDDEADRDKSEPPKREPTELPRDDDDLTPAVRELGDVDKMIWSFKSQTKRKGVGDKVIRVEGNQKDDFDRGGVKDVQKGQQKSHKYRKGEFSEWLEGFMKDHSGEWLTAREITKHSPKHDLSSQSHRDSVSSRCIDFAKTREGYEKRKRGRRNVYRYNPDGEGEEESSTNEEVIVRGTIEHQTLSAVGQLVKNGKDGVTTAEIAEVTTLDKRQVSATLTTLKRKGVIAKSGERKRGEGTRQGASFHEVSITPAGEAELDRLGGYQINAD